MIVLHHAPIFEVIPHLLIIKILFLQFFWKRDSKFATQTRVADRDSRFAIIA